MIRIISFVCSLLMFSIPAIAQPVLETNDGLAVWYDVRPTAAQILSPATPFTKGTQFQTITCKCATVDIPFVEAGNDGGPGDGQTLYLSPRLPYSPILSLGLHWTGFKGKSGVVTTRDNSRASLYRYLTVQSRGGIDEVMVSLGLHTEIVKQGVAGVGNAIEHVAIMQNASYWHSTSEVVSPDGTQESDVYSIDTYASRDPEDVGGSPVYNPSGGVVPSLMPYRVAELQFTAGVWKKGINVRNSVYHLRDSVNDGLILRADADGLSAVPEAPDFGYTTDLVSGTPNAAGAIYRTGSVLNANHSESNSGGDGLTIGTTSVQVDATIVVMTKGDFNHDGTVTSGDNAGYNQAIAASANGTLRVRERYLGDFNVDGLVSSGDNLFYRYFIIITASADCSVPANCP